ncbi:MAG: hypothetical protein K5656_01415 [Lachnospiraceae bacterium]|nr:hypothetical protein [Lachnospiraceae bacterium]
MTDQDIDKIVDKIMERMGLGGKEMLTIKELVSLGYPEKMLRELSHASYARSVIKRHGQGSVIYFYKPKLQKDIEVWQSRQ